MPVRVLIADDHELFRRTVRSFVESRPDYQVCGEAGDGVEAVEEVRKLRPDVVLMDINMPRMDGLEATRIIRREFPESHILIVTQNHASVAREQARSVGAGGSVTKSELTRELFPTIEKLLGGANTESQQETADESASVDGWVRAGGALGKLVHEFDWGTTPLGPIDHWPPSLKTVVSAMLASRFAMWMSWGPELTFLYNDAYAKMTLGKKHPWALGKPSEKVWEEIWGDIGPRIRKVLESGQATWDEGLLLFLERSGYREETYHTFSYSPLTDDGGKVAGHLCVVTEDTDRVIGDRRLNTLRSLGAELAKTTTEEDVLESVARALGENQQDLPFSLTYLFSEDGKRARLAGRTGIAAGHEAAPELIELGEANSVWPIKDLLLSRKDSLLIEDLGERFESAPPGAWETPPTRALLLPIASQTQVAPAGVLITALNPYRPLDVSYAGFLNLIVGQVAASVANARAYEEEKKRAEALAEIDRAKTLFFSNVSHEFRTPLTLMMGPLEDMRSEIESFAPHQQERLDIAHRNSFRLLKLVNNLLDFSRIEAGRFEATYEPIDLSRLTSDLASVFRSAMERAGLRLVVKCPPLGQPVYVDRELWEKIVFNLLSNAFKFTFEGEIEVSTRRVDGSAELAVRDTGTGIPTEDVPHLFERFYRVKNAQGRTSEGTGIGLALVQELAKQHGGTVRVESEIGRGSTFTVTIPLGEEHLPPDRIGASRTLVSTALRSEAYSDEMLHWLPNTAAGGGLPWTSSLQQFAEGRLKVVLADDNADMREYVQQLLAPTCEVYAVSDGQAALRVIDEHRPDLVITDVMMPKLDGFGLLKKLRFDDRTAAIPVIMLSARGEDSRVDGIAAGADDYLTKPFSGRELIARVHNHIRLARGRHAGQPTAAAKSSTDPDDPRRGAAALEPPAGDLDCFAGSGEMAERMRLLDWSQTPPGPVQQWPQSLKTSVSICLASRFPIVMYWGPEFVVLYNDAYSTILGGKHPWALGQRCRDCWAEIWDTIGPMLEGVVSSGRATWSDDLLLPLRRSGYPEECYFSFSFSPIRVETGVIGGVFTAVIETTEKVIGERRLKTLRDLASRAVEAKTEADAWRIAASTLGENPHDIPFAVLCEVAGAERQIRIAGAAGIAGDHEFCRALGTPSSLLCREVIRAAEFHEALNVNNLGDFAGALPCGAWKVPPESIMILPLGEPVLDRPSWILVAAVSPHKKVDAGYRTFFLLTANQIGNSVADARSYELERKRAQSLAELDRAKTVFFSNVSHEFRTPLTLMLGPLEDALSVRDGLPAKQRERLELAHRNSLRLLKLVNTLLDFSRIEAGRIEARYEPTDLAGFTVELASVFRSAIERAGVKLQIKAPQISEPVYIDRGTWEKIVFNLLSNALKFTFAGEIEVALREVNGAAELSVRDTGTGIPPEDVPHLFERFYRVQGAHGRTFEGSGIGLALVQELARLHGGTVRVESQLGRGSTFTVTMPLGKSHLPPDRIAAGDTAASSGLRGEAYVQEALHWLPEAGARTEDGQLTSSTAGVQLSDEPVSTTQGRARILLADDNADMREYVGRLLRSRYEVIRVADGITALESSRQQAPDLVIADVMMPRMGGFGLLREFRADERLATIPVILLSARAGEESRIDGLRAGADDYLSKPFSARELLARVDSHLALARVRRHASELERQLREKAEVEQKRLRELFVQAPAAICLLSGPEHRYTFVNREYIRATGRSGPEDFLGATLGETLPEVERQGFGKLLDEVYNTGVPHIATEARVMINSVRDGQPEEVYFNFVYQAMRDVNGQIDSVLVHAVDVTQQVLARKQLENREKQYRELAERLDVEVRARTRELESRNAEVLRQWEQLRQLSWQLLHAQDEERRHIARELHDSAGQTLAVLGINLSMLVTDAKEKAPDIAESAEEASEIVQQLTKDIRTMSYLLHPPLLDENGLPAALSWYIGGLADRSGLDISFRISEEFGRLPREMELAVFRLVQECLTNIHRHSESRSATIEILRDPERVLVEVRDQGKGIPKEKLAEIQSRGAGVGIRGMRERLRQFQGEVIIDSPGAGTTVIATIPIGSEGRTVEGRKERSATLGL